MGGFVATCPALPGLVTEGDTLEEAREMVKDAIRGYLESLAMDGLEASLQPRPQTENAGFHYRAVRPQRRKLFLRVYYCWSPNQWRNRPMM
jgi:predicted RNase H-like HicB family nuclease